MDRPNYVRIVGTTYLVFTQAGLNAALYEVCKDNGNTRKQCRNMLRYRNGTFPSLIQFMDESFEMMKVFMYRRDLSKAEADAFYLLRKEK